MGNPLLAFWHLFAGAPDEAQHGHDPEHDHRRDHDREHPHWPGHINDQPARAHRDATGQTIQTGAIFLVLRRMRAPIIALILVIFISAVGLTLIPGEQPDGGTDPLTPFEALYFVTFTATTIGFGEIPYPMTTAQRMWVTFEIYFVVIAWAFAIGTLLSLLQDRNFRREVNIQRFIRQVRRMPQPFLIVLGYGDAGSLVVQELDLHGRRLVVVDRSQDRIDSLDLASLHADVPALAANVRHASTLQVAGLEHPRCAGVLALTDDDDANLAAVQAAWLLRPELPVVARAGIRATAERMRAFGDPTVVDPFDAFGDRLRVILRTPALAQLFDWLVSVPGEPPPPRVQPPDHGQWILVGRSRSVVELGHDLATVDVPFVEVDPTGSQPGNPGPQDEQFARLVSESVGMVVAAERGSTNVSYIEAARRAKPDLFIVARQESVVEDAVFAALAPDMLLVPAAVVAREVLERLANPALWDFLIAAKDQGDAWAADTLGDLVRRVGLGSPDVWQERLDTHEGPALVARLAAGPVRLGDLMPSPFARSERLPICVLMLNRGSEHLLMPGDEVELQVGDILLVAGGPGARRGWDATLGDETALDYVLSGQLVASSWWGRWLTRQSG